MGPVLKGRVETATGSITYKIYAKRTNAGSHSGYICQYKFIGHPREKDIHIPEPASGTLTDADVAAVLHEKWDPPAVAGPAAAPVVARSPPPPAAARQPTPVPSPRFKRTREKSYGAQFLGDAAARTSLADLEDDEIEGAASILSGLSPVKKRRLEPDSGGEVDESDSGDDTARALPGAAPAPAQPPTQGLVSALAQVLGSRIDAPPVAKGRIRKGLELKQRLEAKEEKMASSEEESDSDDDVEELTRTGTKRKQSSLTVSARSNISRDVAALKEALFIIGSGSKERTRLLFQRFGEDAFFDAWSDRTNDVVVENIRAVVTCEKLQHKGTRPLPEQHAIDAVAACVASSKSKKRRDARAIARATGLRRATIARGAVEREFIMERGIRARKRTKRWDTRDYSVVRDFCHLEEISRLDTNARHAVRVSLEDGTVEMHEPHTRMMTCGDVARAFLKSDDYRLWQLSNVNPETGEPLKMSFSRVLMNLCPCLRPPTWRECADPIKSGMRECVPGVLLMLY